MSFFCLTLLAQDPVATELDIQMPEGWNELWWVIAGGVVLLTALDLFLPKRGRRGR